MEQNALIMHHEIVPMKIKRSRLPTIGDVSRRLNKTNAPRPKMRHELFDGLETRHFTIVSRLLLAKIRPSVFDANYNYVCRGNNADSRKRYAFCTGFEEFMVEFLLLKLSEVL